MRNFHAFKVNSISGTQIDFSGFSGKKIIVVNVASECGYTPQYQQLQELYDEFNDKLVIIGFPCNDFGGQEPGSEADIQAFCDRNYGVAFPMTAKIGIKKEPHPIYQWLQNKAENGVLDHSVKWNFHKFLIDEKGGLYAAYASSVSPFDDRILSWITD
ncbi:MAG: glutathione peroxidase [Phaeodactylibacter sp.]|uniref:glutathione peroxidase n=1 Tax=Phaeodactylibacter sp. TaxID=1940289 RepID=UPI0032EB376C